MEMIDKLMEITNKFSDKFDSMVSLLDKVANNYYSMCKVERIYVGTTITRRPYVDNEYTYISVENYSANNIYVGINTSDASVTSSKLVRAGQTWTLKGLKINELSFKADSGASNEVELIVMK